MSQYQPQQQPPQHPAAAYYAAPGQTPDPPKDLSVMAWFAFASAALATVVDLANASIVGRAVRELDTDPDSVEWSVVAYGLGSILEGVLLIAGFVTAGLWLYRARTNAAKLAPTAQYTRSAGWAWGGWVCPVVSLWFPFQVVRDTRRAVTPLLASSLVGWWWAAYLVMQLGGRIAAQSQRDATAADAGTVQGIEVFFALVMVVALVLWGLVLRGLTREQHDRIYGRVAVR